MIHTWEIKTPSNKREKIRENAIRNKQNTKTSIIHIFNEASKLYDVKPAEKVLYKKGVNFPRHKMGQNFLQFFQFYFFPLIEIV